MKVDRIILRFVRVPLRFTFQNRWQKIREWTKLIAEVQTADGAYGYGESTAMETPYYSYETSKQTIGPSGNGSRSRC